MREGEARAALVERVHVTRQLITLAKAFLVRPEMPKKFRPQKLVIPFVRQQGLTKPEKVVLHSSVEPMPYIEQAAGYLTCELAFAQASWDLVHEGYYLPHSTAVVVTPPQRWTTVIRMGSTYLRHCRTASVRERTRETPPR